MKPNRLESTELLDQIRANLRHEISRHPFLLRFGAGELTCEQMRRFAVQWYLTAKLHKDAFPAIVLNTNDEDIRFDLIEILREEYGSGDREKIHGRMLGRFVESLGLDVSDISESDAIPGVKHFGDEVLRIWRDDPPARAFGVHFALETIAALFHGAFADGVAASRLTSETEYFDVHRTAEEGHADISVDGFLKYSGADESRRQLLDGIDAAREILSPLLDDLDRHIFADSAQAA